MTPEEIKKLERGTEMIIPEGSLAKKIALAEKENRPLIIKFGMDPTAPDLHLGHAVGLKKLRQFQELGHEIHLLVGNFTAMIGDPTGRNTTRPPLTEEEVKVNAQTYLEQMDKVIDTKKNVKICFNGDWMGKMSFADMIKVMGKMTLAQIMQREDFDNRFKNKIPIAMHELVYPMIQGYDSVVMKSDIEFGGRDQLFNCLVGKNLQEAFGAEEGQTVICMPLLRGLDGEMKMSKSKGNYIGLTEDANTMYGKTMSIPDSLLEEWLELASDFSEEEKADMIASLKNQTVNPMEIKKKLAFNITMQYHSEDEAKEAENFFYRQVQQKGFDSKTFTPVEISSLGTITGMTLVNLCSALVPEQSKSALRRLIESGAVSLNDEKVTDVNMTPVIETGLKIKIGKRQFFELI
ncbi:MAG: tyrosine--tRNA ligase [Alphaproteobacteria bacterium]|nr:tyrosine--tRNA ligase [Alphaproteobacteria bacterium]